MRRRPAAVFAAIALLGGLCLVVLAGIQFRKDRRLALSLMGGAAVLAVVSIVVSRPLRRTDASPDRPEDVQPPARG